MRRFQQCNPFCHPRSRKISTFLQTILVNYRFAPFLSEKFKFKIFTGFTSFSCEIISNLKSHVIIQYNENEDEN